MSEITITPDEWVGRVIASQRREHEEHRLEKLRKCHDRVVDLINQGADRVWLPADVNVLYNVDARIREGGFYLTNLYELKNLNVLVGIELLPDSEEDQ